MIRNSILSFVLIGVVAAGPPCGANEIEAAKTRFEHSLSLVLPESNGKLAQLQGQYLTSLSNLVERVQRDGNLDAVLEVRGERERFLREKNVNPEAMVNSSPNLRKLQRHYAEWAAALDKEGNQQARRLALHYDHQLAAMQKTLTLQRQTDKANAVQEERTRVAATYALEPTTPLPGSTPGTNGTSMNGRGPSIVYPFARKLASQGHRVDMRTWSELPGKVVVVSGDPRKECETGVIIGPQDKCLVLPCPEDRWNTSPARWADEDFRGHRKETELATNGMPFMQMCFSLDGGRLVSLVDNYILDQPGRLLLAPSDREGGGGPENNTGSIRVKIVPVR